MLVIFSTDGCTSGPSICSSTARELELDGRLEYTASNESGALQTVIIWLPLINTVGILLKGCADCKFPFLSVLAVL